MAHTTVLLHESIDGLDLHEGDIFLDGTLGGGGHSEEAIKRHGNSIYVIGLDADEDAIARSKKRLASYDAHIDFILSNFRNLNDALDALGIEKVHKMLLDLGWSTDQLTSGRGLSFQVDEPLLMTFKKNVTEEDVTAQTIVNEWSEDTIITLLEAYGEEQFAKRIARAIIQKREEAPITTTNQLVEVITNAVPFWYRHRKIHPATKTFQALRIAVNDELTALKEGLQKGFERLHDGGRMAVISFHSTEDRIVKQFFQDLVKSGRASFVNKKPITPQDSELEQNRRARSAKLRIITKKK